MMYFVKTIRANKSGTYDKYLSDEDRAVINTQILPSLWYPYETYKHCFLAVFEVIAKSNLEEVREWGNLYGGLFMDRIYRNGIDRDQTLANIRRIPAYINSLYNVGNSEVIVEGPSRALVQLHDCDPEFYPLYYFFLGWFQKIAEIFGARHVRCEFDKMGWVDHEDTTSYIITWD